MLRSPIALPTYRTIERGFEFLSHFQGFHLTHLCIILHVIIFMEECPWECTEARRFLDG